MSTTDSPLGFHEVTLGETRFVLWCWYQDTFGYGVAPMAWRDGVLQRLKEADVFLMWLGEPPERLLELTCRYLASYCGPQTTEVTRLLSCPKCAPEVLDVRVLEREELGRSRRTRGRRRTRARPTRATPDRGGADGETGDPSTPGQGWMND